MGILSSLVSGLISPVVNYFNTRQQLSAQEAANKLAFLKAVGDRQAQLVSQGLAADATWELESIKAGQQYRGFELYVVSVPLVLCFIPGGAAIVEHGFAAIAKTPAWYQIVFLSIFLANYGIRYWRRNQSDT